MISGFESLIMVDLLIDTMARCCDPIFIYNGATTPMRTWEAEKWCSPHAHLPRVFSIRRILPANDARLGTPDRREATICSDEEQCCRNKRMVVADFNVIIEKWYEPELLAADIVDRFGLSRFSSKMSFESAGDNKSLTVASLEITWFSSVVEMSSVVVLFGRRVDNADAAAAVVDVVANLIGVDDDDIDWYGDIVERMVDENGDCVVRRVVVVVVAAVVVDGRIVVIFVVGFAACML